MGFFYLREGSLILGNLMVSRLCVLKKAADERGETPLEELYTMKNLKS
jgi:hypothetical protein